MKIITKYVLKEHLGPFTFAFSALTSLLLINYLGKELAKLVGKGLPTAVVLKFIGLSIPFTVAMTLPMSVLVAVLYAFSRLAAEMEITALKASGVSMWRLQRPVLLASIVLTGFMVYFNDQVLPAANHQLATLSGDILRTKPAFALREQVINPVIEGQLFMRAGRVERGSSDLEDVVVYDMGDSRQSRTIYAKRGRVAMAANGRDMEMTLYDGVMQSVPVGKPDQLTRIFYRQDRIRVRDVTSRFEQSGTRQKSEREMTICEMQEQLATYALDRQRARNALRDAEQAKRAGRLPESSAPGVDTARGRSLPGARGVGSVYCDGVARLGTFVSVKEAQAAQGPDARGGRAPLPGVTPNPAPPPRPADETQSGSGDRETPASENAVGDTAAGGETGSAILNAALADARLRLDEAEKGLFKYQVEINKKFSLAVSCFVFALLGPPLALRFPRGGVGFVIGVSLFIFALNYVGLIAGEALADRGMVSPVGAMWVANAILAAIGLLLTARMGRETGTGRGGGIREWWDNHRARRAMRRTALRAR